MRIDYTNKLTGKERFGCLVLFFFEDKLSPPAEAPREAAREVRRMAVLKDFTGKTGQTQVLPLGSGSIGRVLCVGLGKANKLERESLRRAVGKAAKELVGMNLDAACMILPKAGGKGLQQELGAIIAEGVLLGGYKFEPYKQNEDDKKSKRKKLSKVTLLDAGKASSAKSVRRGVTRGEAICLARTLGNQPANVMTPLQLAAEARKVAKRRGLKIRVLEQAQMEKLGLGMFMGVARGSRQPPKMILMEYRPRGAKGTLLFVGKGITFDSGGISLKPGHAMDEMKFDMCGAAAVVGAMDGIGATKPNVNVVGYPGLRKPARWKSRQARGHSQGVLGQARGNPEHRCRGPARSGRRTGLWDRAVQAGRGGGPGHSHRRMCDCVGPLRHGRRYQQRQVHGTGGGSRQNQRGCGVAVAELR